VQIEDVWDDEVKLNYTIQENRPVENQKVKLDFPPILKSQEKMAPTLHSDDEYFS
jgi:hypothetical protein